MYYGGRHAHLVKVVLLHLIHGIGNMLGFGLFVWLHFLHTWGIPPKIGIIWRGSGQGTSNGVIALR